MNIENKISSTMMIPLYHKMCETKRELQGLECILKDYDAVRICENIEYDFSVYENDHFSKIGCCVRANYFDNKAFDFINKYENAVIINAGCGLDARYSRVLAKNPKNINSAFFYDVDLDEVIKIRQKFYKENHQNKFLIGNILNNDWIKYIKESHPNSHYLVICEGVLMYISNDDIKTFLKNLQIIKEFEFWCDFLGSKFYKKQQVHKTLDKLNINTSSYIDSENDFIKLIDFSNINCIETKTYFSIFTKRYGLKAMFFNLFPDSFLKKYSFLAGFLIKNDIKS